MPEFPGDPRLRDIWAVHSTRNGVPPEPAPEVSRETDERADPRDVSEPSPVEEQESDAPPPEAALEAAPLKRSHHKKRL